MDRVQLKLTGKKNFQKNRGSSIAACLPYTLPNFIVSVFSLVMVVIFVSEMFTAIIDNIHRYEYNSYYQQSIIINTYKPLFNALEIILRVIMIIFPIFLAVLVKKFFLMNRVQGSCKASEAFSSFKGSEYVKTLGGMFLRSLWLIIPYSMYYLFSYLSSWLSSYLSLYFFSLFFLLYILCIALLIIGIIKFYFSYFMVPYILAENPNIGAIRAIKISNKTMIGAKGELFVFYLSFIGWSMLGVLTLGILDIFYVMPYCEAAKAELYSRLKQKAKKLNICNADELA